MLMMLTTVVMVIVSLFVDIQRCRRGQELVNPIDSNCDPVSIIIGYNILVISSNCTISGPELKPLLLLVFYLLI